MGQAESSQHVYLIQLELGGNYWKNYRKIIRKFSKILLTAKLSTNNVKMTNKTAKLDSSNLISKKVEILLTIVVKVKCRRKASK